MWEIENRGWQVGVTCKTMTSEDHTTGITSFEMNYMNNKIILYSAVFDLARLSEQVANHARKLLLAP